MPRSPDEALLGQLLQHLVHDLTGPLVTVRLYVNQIEGCAPDSKAGQLALRAGKVVDSLLERLMGASRFMRSLEGQAQDRLEVVRLPELIEAALLRVLLTRNMPLVSVSRSYRRGLQLLGNAEALMTMFHAVLLNSVESFGPTGGRISIQVTSTGPKEARIAVVDIVDDGLGIESVELQRVGNLGYTTKHGNRGFGLHVARQVVEQHGGSMSITSDGLGRGTRVTISVPEAVR